MIRAILSMSIKEGCEEDFIHAWQAIAAYAQSLPEHLGQALLRDSDNPARFIITSDWSSEEAFHTFERSQKQEQLTAPLRAMRRDSHMELYQIVQLVEKG